MTRAIKPILYCLLILALFGAAGLSCRSLIPSPQPTSPPQEPTPTPLPSATPAPIIATAAPTSSPVPSGPPFSAEMESASLPDFPPNGSLQISFDQPIDPHSTELALLSYPYVPAEQIWDTTFTQLTFQPTHGFSPNRQYRLFLNSALRSAADGAPASQPLWELHTRPAPALEQISPSSGPLYELLPRIELTFSTPMNAASLSGALVIQPEAAYDLIWKSEQTLVIEITKPLTPGVKYTFTVSTAARDQDGVPLEKDQRWEYRLTPLVGGFGGLTPDDLRQPLRVQLNYQIDEGSFIENARLLDPQGRPAPGRWEWDSPLSARFVPGEALQPGRQYSLAFTGDLQTNAGLVLQAIPSTTYQSPPPVLFTYPNEDGAFANTDVRITFSIPVDHASVEANFRLDPPAEGSFAWDGDTLIFQPTALDVYQTYTAILDPGARAENGEPLLLEPYAWSFYIQPSQSMDAAGVSFGEYGPNAQVLDFDGRRAVQFLAWKTRSVTFELYRLTLDQFLQRYSSNFRGVVGFETRPISIEGAALQKTWQQAISGDGWGYDHMIYEAILPEDVPAGLYILNLSTGDEISQLILVLTRNTLVLKQASDQVSAWVTDINGAPRPQARIGIYARDGKRLAQGRADQSGFFSARVGRDPAPLIVIAEDSQTLTGRDIQYTDITISGLGNEWQSGRSWWGWWQPTPDPQTISAHIHTDRPIYRPGQTVFYKAILRLDDDALLSLPPENTPVTARIRDARQNVVATQELQTNAFGSINGQFALAEGAMTGDYQVEIQAAGGAIQQRFKVQDYAKPDYAVTVSAASQHYITSDPMQFTISARYYYDQPVPANAKARLYELTSSYDGWSQDADPEAVSYQWTPLWSVEERQVTLNEDGLAQLELPAPQVEEYSSYWYQSPWSNQRTRKLGLEVTVEDASGQSVSSFAVVTVHNSSEMLELDSGGYIRRTGQAFTVSGSLHSLEGTPLAGKLLTLEVRTHEGRAYNYDRILQTYQAQTGPDGTVAFQVSIPDPGGYLLRLSGIDSQGRATYISDWVYVTSSSSRWVIDYIQELKITAERSSYAPGENARLLVESSFSGPALLSFERGSVRRALEVQLTSPLTVIETPILETDVPNIYVTINAWQAQNTDFSLTGEFGSETSLADSQIRTSRVRIDVPPQNKRLQVTITPAQPVYGPGETALVTVQVSDEQGNPVQAELSLAVVDEAIYALSNDLSRPIFDAFYGPRRNRVRTFDSMQPRRVLMAFGRGGGGDGGEGGMRADFPDTAVWLPELLTGENGQVVVEVPLPDNLTTWRLTARAAAQDNRFGQNIASLVTQKPVVVRPLLPRTLTQGDSLLLAAQVHNYTSQSQTLDVHLTTGATMDSNAPPAFELHSPPTQTVAIEPGQSTVINWAARSLLPGTAYVSVRAFSTAEDGRRLLADGVLLPLEVRPLAVLDQVTFSGEFTGAYETVLPLPSGVLDSSTVQIELSRSVAGGLLDGLEGLTGFPYGCVEQTMSRALPNAVVGRAFRQLGAGRLADNPDLPGLINAGLQRLYGYQHDDGGWGWWFDDDTDDYQTAWVVFGLSVTAEAGYDVDPLVIERGAQYLSRVLQRPGGDIDVRTRAYALYSLAYAGYGDLGASLDLYEERRSLDTFSQAALALALHHLGAGSQAETMISDLAESAFINGDLIYWPNAAEDGHYHDKTMSSTLRSTALALDAFVSIQPGHALEPGIVRYLMSQRRPDGWGSTNETSFAILALTDHLLSVEAQSAETPYQVLLDGQVLAEGVLGAGEPAVSLPISVAQFPANSAPRLVFSSAPQQRLYYAITSRMYFAQAELPAAGQVIVERAYLDPQSGQPLESIQSGDLVKVVLTVQLAQPAFFFLVEDRLPGGLEALNESLNTTSHDEELYQYGGQQFFWRELGYNFKEVRADRVTFFITQLEAGLHTYSYLARAVRSGEFTAMPAEAYAMYNSALWGRSATNRMLVALPAE